MLNIVYNCNMKSSFCRPLPTVETTMKVEMPFYYDTMVCCIIIDNFLYHEQKL